MSGRSVNLYRLGHEDLMTLRLYNTQRNLRLKCCFSIRCVWTGLLFQNIFTQRTFWSHLGNLILPFKCFLGNVTKFLQRLTALSYTRCKPTLRPHSHQTKAGTIAKKIKEQAKKSKKIFSFASTFARCEWRSFTPSESEGKGDFSLRYLSLFDVNVKLDSLWTHLEAMSLPRSLGVNLP